MAGLNNNANAFLTHVRLGPQYIQLVPGPPGPDGQNAVTTTTTANFTQPAVGSTVSIAVTSTAGIAAGLNVFVKNGGYYSVVSVTDGTHFVASNTGAAGNLGPGGTVALGSLVVPAGPAGALTIQNAGATITQRAILNLIGLGYFDGGGAMNFIAGGGIGTIVTVSSGTTATLSEAVAQTLIVDTTSTRPIRVMPASPNDLDVVRATFIGSTNNNGVEFQPNTGQTIGDLANPGTFKGPGLNASVSFTPGDTPAFFYQLANTRWVPFS